MTANLTLITDSTCDLPTELIEQYDLIILPIPIYFGKEIRQQYIDITIDEFFKKVEQEKDFPTTGIPSPGTFDKTFKKALNKGNNVLLVCASKELTGLYENAIILSKQLTDNSIEVIDSRATTHALGLMILKLSRMIKEGKTKDEIINHLQNKLIPNITTMISVESLDFMKRSGRIRKLQYSLANFLKLKPIVTLDDGKIILKNRVIGTKGIMKFLKKFGDRILKEIPENETLVIGHSRNQRKAEELLDYLKSKSKKKLEYLIWEIGPTLGVHVGPGALSLLWIGEAKK